MKFESVDDEGGKKSPDANRWVCPVSRKELGPGTKAVYIVPCGHAFAETAVREVGDSHTGCLTVSLHSLDDVRGLD